MIFKNNKISLISTYFNLNKKIIILKESYLQVKWGWANGKIHKNINKTLNL